MAELGFDTLYVNGDSWSAGDIVDPEIFGNQLQHSMHPDNKPYRLPRVWPHKLGKLLDVEVINNSHAGASNDRIVRETINDLLEIIKYKKPEDLFVIIGFSSPERKDFYYHREDGPSTWDTVYPAEMHHWKDEEDSIRNEFYKNYVSIYWNPEEFITRHCLNTFSLHYFLKANNIKHAFFNAFYEDKSGVVNPDRHQLYDQPKLSNFMNSFKSIQKPHKLEHLGIDKTIEEYENIYESNFIKKSFIQHLLEESYKYKKLNEILDFHPTEEGHKLWAQEIKKTLFNYV